MATATVKPQKTAWISGAQASLRAGVPVASLLKFVERGELSYRRIGQGYHQFVREEIDELVEKSTRPRRSA